jgi:hypothetical protein
VPLEFMTFTRAPQPKNGLNGWLTVFFSSELSEHLQKDSKALLDI